MKKIVLLFTGLFALVFAHSQAGTLDPSFAGKGWTYANFEKSHSIEQNELSRQVLLQNDGTYIIVFEVNGYTVLTRYFPNSNQDSSFGTDGYTEAVKMIDAKASLQSDGKIVVAGSIKYNFDPPFAYLYDIVVTRYNANGSLDSSFNGEGKLVTNVSNEDQPTAIAVQRDGKIVLAGTILNPGSRNYDVVLIRYNMDGSLDSSFDKDGRLTTGTGFVNSIAIQNEGRIVAAGSSSSGFALDRFNADGSLDSTFGKNGKRTINFGAGGYAASVAIQKDGKIVVAGYTEDFINTSITYFALARCNADGSLDSTFDKNGKLTTRFSEYYTKATSMALQEDGKIVVAGNTEGSSGDLDYALARYNTDGSLDSSFDKNGKLVTDFSGGQDRTPSVAVQGDGKIVMTGTTEGPNTYYSDFTLVRYNSQGSLDSTFDKNGKLISYYSASLSALNAITVQIDGKVVAAGSTIIPNTNLSDFALARYNIDGSLDSTFGKNGKLTTDISGVNDVANSLALQNDGKIVTAGNSASNFALARYNTDGSLDSTFDKNGKLVTDFGVSSYAVSVAVQKDGKIVMAGYTQVPNTRSFDFALARYNTDGSLDNSFDKNGKLTTDFLGGSDDRAASMAIQNDGKIIVAGMSQDLNTYRNSFALARYNTDGSLDSSFDKNGKLITVFSDYYDNVSATAYSVAIQSDNKIVVAGYATGFNSDRVNFALARYNTDGSLDNSFDNDGMLVTHFFGNGNYAYSIAVQRDDKIIVAGRSQDSNTYLDNGAFARYNVDGSLDSSFGNKGKLTADFFIPSSIHIDQNRLYAGGSIYGPGLRGVVAAYLLDCTRQTFYKDSDQDGYGNISQKVLGCIAPSGYVADSTDCNDTSASIHPGTEEICGNGKDDNCNGKIDEDCNTVTTWYRDADGDGFGNPAQPKVADIQPKGYVGNNLDCNDKNKVKGGPEVCDGIDNDCNGIIDDGLAEITFYSDFDGDGYGSDKRTITTCVPPPRYVALAGDLNDDNKNVYPGAPELCDGRDNNQNGEIDEGFPKTTFYHDFDKDGYGRAEVALQACAAPLNYVAIAGDCDDRNAAIHPGASGPPNDGIDNNCNGLIDEPLHNVVTDKGSALIGEQSETLLLTVRPNPTTHYFTLHIQSASNHAVQLRMIDEVGRVVEVRQGLTSRVTLTVGHNYRPGVYFAEALQDGNRASIRLIKQ